MSDVKAIWCNAEFPADALAELSANLSGYRLVFSHQRAKSVLQAGGHDPLLAEADIAFGQPDPAQVMLLPRIRWVHLTSAGYTRYDTDAFRSAMQSRGGILTNSSGVYCEPCAEHALAMILAMSRQLPAALDDQRGSRTWPDLPLRADCHLLRGQSILIYGYGAIARRLVELLRPLGMKITGVRRQSVGDEGIPIVTPEQADALLAHVDHVMNILPASASTEQFFNARRLGLLAPTALFYNIGRGTTVDQDVLLHLLQQRKITGAYLDVTTPEPLPKDHPLWALPNCWITPHSAGGHHDEMVRLVRHFRMNLDRYSQGRALVDMVIKPR
jgi:phosphoglycerate dehydrogenase-like enzyme